MGAKAEQPSLGLSQSANAAAPGVWLEPRVKYSPLKSLGSPGTHWGPWTPGLHRQRPDWKSQWPLPQSAHTNAQSSP